MTDVPVIDIAPFLGGSAADRAAVADEVDAACRDIGFFQIVGHQVPNALTTGVYETARAFFAQSEDEKERVAQPSPDQVRGWSGVGKEGLSYSLDEAAPGDLKEKMDIGPPDVDRDDPYFGPDAAGPHFAPNVWPEHLDGFRETWEEYFRAMSGLSADLMKMFAVGLGLPIEYFEPTIDHHISMLRALHYPNQVDEPLPGQLRAGAHSDYGSLTIVRQEDRPGGLQVFSKSAEWVDVPVVEDGFVVNIGDLMAEWTNDRWVSTLHRVVNPPRDLAHDADRVSVVFFHQPNYDAVISCLPTVLEPGESPKYPPVTSGQHLYDKFTKQTAMETS